MVFRTAVDIANRALQHVGASMLDPLQGFTEASKNAREVSFVYDKVRRAELRRNIWRFTIRNAVLRPVDVSTLLLTPALWQSTTTYFVGSIVSDETGMPWISLIQNNLNNQPETSYAWAQYFGPMTVNLWTAATAYFTGELVYTAAGDGTNRVYISRQSDNADNPATATQWSATETYFKNDVVTRLSVAYMSLIDLNINQTPPGAAWTTTFVGGTGSIKWLQIGGAEFPAGATVTPFNVVFPIGSGPSAQTSTRNAFRLPGNYLRNAPQDPKSGSSNFLGAPTGLTYPDWDFQGNYFVSREADPIVFRFVADMVDVREFDDLFCEGLAARMALEVCEPITQSSEKLKTIASIYTQHMNDARTVNGIETGSVEPPMDDYIACRG